MAEEEVDGARHDPVHSFAGRRPVVGQGAACVHECRAQSVGGEAVAQAVGEAQFVETILRRNLGQCEINRRKRIEEDAARHVQEGVQHLPFVVIRFAACEIELQMILSGRQK